MERVKRFFGNEIELGMKIPTIESRESNIPMDKGNYVCCHNGSCRGFVTTYVLVKGLNCGAITTG